MPPAARAVRLPGRFWVAWTPSLVSRHCLSGRAQVPAPPGKAQPGPVTALGGGTSLCCLETQTQCPLPWGGGQGVTRCLARKPSYRQGEQILHKCTCAPFVTWAPRRSVLCLQHLSPATRKCHSAEHRRWTVLSRSRPAHPLRWGDRQCRVMQSLSGEVYHLPREIRFSRGRGSSVRERLVNL